MAKALICTQCGHIEKPQYRANGSLGVEIILYFFFFVPGLIYSVWRRSTAKVTCTNCKSTVLIPLGSPRATKLLEDQGDSTSAKLIIEQDRIDQEKQQKRAQDEEKFLKMILVGVIIFMIIGLFIAGFAAA